MKAVLRVADLSCSLGMFTLDSVELAVYENEYLVILGPTGAGKTVFLESLLGIKLPSSGNVFLNDTDITMFPPEQRNIGYIPQDYALFPNMTVEENIGYGPYVRNVDPLVIASKVSMLMEKLDISHLKNRYPKSLSGGEKQRVAVGRALAVEPEILLLDEPLAALDETRRSELAGEFRRIQKQSGATFVHVCHNLDEACEVADRVAIMASGKLVQTGLVEDILYRPKCEFVARFTGAVNVFSGKIEGSNQFLLSQGLSVRVQDTQTPANADDAYLVVRPELIVVSRDASALDDEAGTVFTGEIHRIVKRVFVHELTVQVTSDKGSTVDWVISIPSAGDALNNIKAGKSISFLIPESRIVVVQPSTVVSSR